MKRNQLDQSQGDWVPVGLPWAASKASIGRWYYFLIYELVKWWEKINFIWRSGRFSFVSKILLVWDTFYEDQNYFSIDHKRTWLFYFLINSKALCVSVRIFQLFLFGGRKYTFQTVSPKSSAQGVSSFHKSFMTRARALPESSLGSELFQNFWSHCTNTVFMTQLAGLFIPSPVSDLLGKGVLKRN